MMSDLTPPGEVVAVNALGAGPSDRRSAVQIGRSFVGKSGMFGTVVMLAMVFLAVFGPALAPYSAFNFSPDAQLQPPSAEHWFGTDDFGRDVLSRILVGARPTLVVATLSALLGVTLGTLTGLTAGFFGGRADNLVMRVMDAMMSFPTIVLAMMMVSMLGATTVTMVVALAVVFWPRSARLVRSVAQDIAHRDFIDAARARRERSPYILFREVLPNLWPLIVVDASLRLTLSIILSASLSYLGVGEQPPSPAWGLMIQDGQAYLQVAPWTVIAPCVAIAIAAVGVLMFGESLRTRFARAGRAV